MKNAKTKKKIGLIIFWYSIGISPSLINLVINLARSGYEIHIFIDEVSFNYAKISFKNKNITLQLIKKIPKQWPENESFFRRIIHQINVLISLYRYCNEVSLKIDENYFLLIGADAFGIIAARYVSLRKKIPFIYYNLELLLAKECQSLKEKTIKFFERKASQSATFTIIQDRRRAKYLAQDNKLKYKNIEYIPVSVFQSKIKKSYYLQKKFNIPYDKKILLYAGEIEPDVMCLELVEAAQSWDNDFVLVIHASKLHDSAIKYIENMRAINKNRQVYFSLDPVEWDKVPELLSSADIGLAFYRNVGKNYFEIGQSSGKLASYLEVGLPVITIDFPSLREIIDEYKVGKYTHDFNRIESLAKEIIEKFNFYHNNALKCFEEKYNNAKYFPKILKRIKGIELHNE